MFVRTTSVHVSKDAALFQTARFILLFHRVKRFYLEMLLDETKILQIRI